MQLTRWIAPVVGVALMINCLSPTTALAAAKPPKTEELQGGRWVPIDNAATQPEIDRELLRIEELINAGRYSQASERAVEWLVKNPKSPMKDRGLFLNAEALYRYGDRIKAFYYLDELMDEFAE